MQEVALEGGNTTRGVVRVGDTVRRPVLAGARPLADVLGSLRALGFVRAPRHLGVDERGRDVLSFEEGRTTDHPSQRDERSYAAFGRILRELHDRTRGSAIAAGGCCLVHGDPGPYNTVMRDRMPAALIDWDCAGPGDPLDDVGYAGWTWCIQAVGAVPVLDQARRLRLFRDGYERSLAPEVLLGAVERQQALVAAAERAVLATTEPGTERREHAEAAIAWADRDRALLLEHRALFTAALSRDGGDARRDGEDRPRRHEEEHRRP